MSKPRSIFEEVSTDPGDAPAKPTPASSATTLRARRASARGAIAVWLMVLFALVVAMIAVGGLTRLTDSGLSITEWRPITGAAPPRDAAAWEAEFEKYRAIPQYELVNEGMTLAEFKVIYWWEWGHRQLGRVIGLVWALGFAWFLIRRAIPPGWTGRLLGLGVLGGLQGAIGWWMVTSGLTGTMTSVASYRLAIHLGLAFAILGLIAWYLFALRRTEAELLQARRRRNPALMRWGTVLALVAFAQILLGALVAGIDAGRSFIDWPLMEGQIVPPAALAIEPVWRNFFENAGLVQFNHRLLGYILLVLAVIAWIASRRATSRALKLAFDSVLGMVLIQSALGIFTVWNAAPWHIAIAHQLGAVLLFVLILRARFLALYPPEERIARA